MSIDDTLRELMDERSRGRAVPPDHLGRIHHRVVRRRNRRVGAAAAATALAVAALTGTAIAWPRGTTTAGPPTAVGESGPPPAATLPPLTLPGHDRGQSLVEQKGSPLSPGHGEFTMLYTPRQWNFSISMACVTTPVHTEYQLEILINGSSRPYMVTTCNEPSGRRALPDEPATDDEQRQWWENVHAMVGSDTPVRLNEPMSITVRVGTPEYRYDPRVGGDILRSGAFAAAAGQAVVGVYQPG